MLWMSVRFVYVVDRYVVANLMIVLEPLFFLSREHVIVVFLFNLLRLNCC